MLRSITVLFLITPSCIGNNSTGGTNCTVSATPVKQGQPTSITCHFPVDVKAQKASVHVMRYGKDKPPVLVLSYIWATDQATKPEVATFENGYALSGSVSTHLRILLDGITANQAGNYGCAILPSSNSQNHSQCTLGIAEMGTVTSCTVPSVKIGESTELTCTFNKNVMQVNREVMLYKGPLSYTQSPNELVVDCVRETLKENPVCTPHMDGYRVDTSKMTESSFTVTFFSVTPSSEGAYACKLIAVNPPEKENTCFFNLSGSDTRDSGKKDTNVKPEVWILSVCGSVVVAAVVVAVITFKTCKQKKKHNSTHANTSAEVVTRIRHCSEEENHELGTQGGTPDGSHASNLKTSNVAPQSKTTSGNTNVGYVPNSGRIFFTQGSKSSSSGSVTSSTPLIHTNRQSNMHPRSVYDQQGLDAQKRMSVISEESLPAGLSAHSYRPMRRSHSSENLRMQQRHVQEYSQPEALRSFFRPNQLNPGYNEWRTSSFRFDEHLHQATDA